MNQPPTLTPKRSWWQRHWKWFLPTVIITPILLCGGLITLIIVFIFGALRSTPAYTLSLARVTASPTVQQAIGSPIEPNRWSQGGKFSESGSTGSAQLSYSVSGPKGSGDVHVEAKKSAGQWTLTTLTFTPQSSGKPIDLLANP